MSRLRSLEEFEADGNFLNSKQLSQINGGLADASMNTQSCGTCLNGSDDTLKRVRKDGPSTGNVWGEWGPWYVV